MYFWTSSLVHCREAGVCVLIRESSLSEVPLYISCGLCLVLLSRPDAEKGWNPSWCGVWRARLGYATRLAQAWVKGSGSQIETHACTCTGITIIVKPL